MKVGLRIVVRLRPYWATATSLALRMLARKIWPAQRAGLAEARPKAERRLAERVGFVSTPDGRSANDFNRSRPIEAIETTEFLDRRT